MDIKPWLGKYRIPVEALRLSEDIQTLELILKLVNGLDARTISDDFRTVNNLKTILTGAKRIAEYNLRNDYLAGKRPKREPKETMRDVWQQILR